MTAPLTDAGPGSSPSASTGPVTKGERTKADILAVAIDRFGRDGHRATSVADIARVAGVSGTLAYNYFPNKEALFLAALDEDASQVITEGVLQVLEGPRVDDWHAELMGTLVAAVDAHPLTRRVLAGLEPNMAERVVRLPATERLRATVADRLREEQAAGLVRADIDPVTMAGGLVSIFTAILVAVVQFGEAAGAYAPDVLAVLDAALDPPR